MRKKNRTFILAYEVVLLAVSLILGYIEFMFPINIGQIGIKIGLSNIVSIIGLKTVGVKKTVLINVLRLIILGMLFGNLVRFIISVSGFVVSFAVMSVSFDLLKLSINISSILGGIFHNLGQFIALLFIMKNINVLLLVPIYIVIGVLSGFLVGVISSIIYNNIISPQIEY